MRRTAIVVLLAIALFGPADAPNGHGEASEPPPTRAHCAPIGTNLSMPTYWTRSYPFVDVMKASFPFMSSGPGVWADDRTLALDEHGWPRRLASNQIARTMLLHGETGHPTGRMTVLYDGKGRIEYHGNVQNLERTPGRDTFNLGPGGLYIDITRLDPDDRLRNIRVLMPGGRCEGDDFGYCERDADCKDTRCVPFGENYEEKPFHPQFLQEVRPFRALRFMDWMLTNRHVDDGVEEPEPIHELSEYPTRQHMAWRPVPIDLLVDLANLLGKDAWFNVPHTASDDFVRGMAQRVARRLRADLNVYVEYSNETWNQIFDQHHWVNAQGCRAFSRAPARQCAGGEGEALCSPEVKGRAKNRCVQYGQRWFGRRTVEVGRIWREAFATKGPGRVTVVLGVQVNGSWWYERVLRERLPGGSTVSQHVDAVATAPYFGLPEASSVDEVFARVPEDDDTYPPGTYRLLAGAPSSPRGGVLDWIRDDARFLRKKELRHLRLIAYEAGQGLQHYDPEVSKVFNAANRDPRMRDVYRQYLDHWARLSNGGLLMHFSSASSYTVHGAWGMKEGQDQPRADAPKFDALLAYIEQHRGCPDPHRAAPSSEQPERPPVEPD